jgi:TctA family transporter
MSVYKCHKQELQLSLIILQTLKLMLFKQNKRHKLIAFIVFAIAGVVVLIICNIDQIV